MCGIVGAASRDGAPSRELLDHMRSTMDHRGPDGTGVWRSPDNLVGLGHNRLAIIDLSDDASQPLHDSTERYTIVFNGEIYNYQELRDRLRARGHSFRTQSDTEVIVEAYREWGAECITHFVGMFAFALYDKDERTLFLARDRAGEKPLFYRHTGSVFWFASELKALFAHDELPRQLDLTGLDRYLAYGYVSGDRCLVRGYNKLLPGHTLTYSVDANRLERRRYWQLPEVSPHVHASKHELSLELERLLSDSVARQLVADVPVGILLSGGLDSSLITAIASKATRPVRTFTVSFPDDPASDEGPYARRVAEYFGTEHVDLRAAGASVELLPQLARQFDEPIADHAIVPTSILAKAVREHGAVALGGDGGDELFGGYPHYSFVQRIERIRRLLPGPVRGLMSKSVGRLVPAGVRGRNHLIGLRGSASNTLAHVNLYFDADQRRSLVPALRDWPCTVAEAERAQLCDPALSTLQQATRADFQTTMVDAYLVKVDRASMMSSLEVRAPFLDHRLVEFAFSKVPDRLRATQSERKILLRDLATRLLPPDFDARRKQGFTMPIGLWFKGALGPFVEEVLREADRRIIDQRVAASLLQGQRRGLLNGPRLFSLVMLELWRREHRITVA